MTTWPTDLVLRQRLCPHLDRLVMQGFVQHAWVTRPRVIDSNRVTICDDRPHTVHVSLVAHIEALCVRTFPITSNFIKQQ